MIDWSDPQSQITTHFKVRDAIWLPSWGRLASESDGLSDEVKASLVKFLTDFCEPVRDLLSVPMITHVMFRPEKYNALVRGAKDSAHTCGGPWAAIDFHPAYPGDEPLVDMCERGQTILLPKLEALGLRMEDNGRASWIHLDNKPVLEGRHRFFKP